jgi:holo-[acyl-carrier protein] synthase
MIRGIGIDMVEIERISGFLERQEKLIDRILTQREKELLSDKSEGRKIEFIAGRFAAKEAAAKALGTGIGARLGFHDIEVLPSEAGKPQLHISAKALEAIFSDRSKLRFHLSITHTRTYAAAQVIVEEV